MSTAVWILLSAAGLMVGCLAGYGLRRRREAEVTGTGPGRSDHPSIRDAASDETDDGVVIGATFHGADPAGLSSSGNGDVIDLRPRPTPAPDPVGSAPAVADQVRDGSNAGATANASRTATVTGTDENAVDQDAEIIDLRDRVRTVVPVHNLQFVRGIGPGLDRALRREGILTLADFSRLDRDDLAALVAGIDGLSAKKARTKLQPRARQMLEAAEDHNAAEPPDTAPLRRVRGVGTTMARWLETMEITTLEQLAALDADQVDALDAALIDDPGRIRSQRWVQQARRLLEET